MLEEMSVNVDTHGNNLILNTGLRASEHHIITFLTDSLLLVSCITHISFDFF